MSDTTALHVAIILGCTALAVLAIIAIAVRASRPKGRHVAPAPAADPVWGNLAEHDEAFDAALRDEFPDPAATDDVRSAWMQAPVRAATDGRPPWDSQQFPAIKSPLIQSMEAGEGPGDEAFDRAFWGDHYGEPGEPGDPNYFPDGADMPAAGERLAVTPPASSGDGEPSNLPGPVDPGSRDHHWAGEPSISVATHGATSVQPVLEGIIVLAPVLGYIDGLALTSTYYERIEQIGVQARVLALAAAA